MYVLLLLACQPEEPTPVTPSDVPRTDPWALTIVEHPERATTVESVGLAAGSATSVPDLGLFVESDGALVILDPWFGMTDPFAVATGLRGAETYGDGYLIGTAEGLRYYNDALLPLDVDLQGIQHMDRAFGSVWIDTDDSAVRLDDDGTLTRIRVDATDLQFLRASNQGIYGAVSADLYTWTGSLETSPMATVAPDPIDGLALAADGPTALSGGWLLEQLNGTWRRIDLGSPVRALWAHRDAPVTWARTDDGWRARENGEWFTVDVPGTPVDIDALGRLSFLNATGQLERTSIALPIEVFGLPPGPIEQPITLAVAPTGQDSLTGLSVQLTGAETFELELSELAPFTAEIQPDDYPQGTYTLEVLAEYDDANATTSRDLQLGRFDPTWENSIGTLFESTCYGCHATGTLPVLEDQTSVIANYTAIASQIDVRPPIMPPVQSEAFTSTELQLIQSWALAEFP